MVTKLTGTTSNTCSTYHVDLHCVPIITHKDTSAALIISSPREGYVYAGNLYVQILPGYADLDPIIDLCIGDFKKQNQVYEMVRSTASTNEFLCSIKQVPPKFLGKGEYVFQH